LRPLAANPANPLATKEVSRRHKITFTKSGLLSIIGGKWTSYRQMAEETIDKGIKAGVLEHRKCVTKNLSFLNGKITSKPERLQIYGNQSNEIEKMIIQQTELGDLLDSALPYTKAEILWICRNEMPRAIEDILARRTRALFLDVRASVRIAPQVADIMANELGFDTAWKEKQIKEYNQLALNYL
jgi:glycerol-3-phosphate dehydrogenase